MKPVVINIMTGFCFKERNGQCFFGVAVPAFAFICLRRLRQDTVSIGAMERLSAILLALWKKIRLCNFDRSAAVSGNHRNMKRYSCGRNETSLRFTQRPSLIAPIEPVSCRTRHSEGRQIKAKAGRNVVINPSHYCSRSSVDGCRADHSV